MARTIAISMAITTIVVVTRTRITRIRFKNSNEMYIYYVDCRCIIS